MNEKNINKKEAFARVLVAPLDWGLGHVTRCIPIIHALLKEKVTVFVAVSAPQEKLLQKEFRNIHFLPLEGYNISYPSAGSSFLIKMLKQVPKIISIVRHENRWLKKVVDEYKIDAVISDNRFGLHHKNIKSIYITHQLHIKTGSSFFNLLAQKIHYHYINQFDECWVPDEEGKNNLAGVLSHPVKKPAVDIKYLGILSRFIKEENISKTIDLLVILSGPEPQRTIFESILLEQINDVSFLKQQEYKIVFVRGLPLARTIPESKFPGIKIFNHLPAKELCDLIQQAKIVISRSGYSTVMDLIALQQKAILVPTPGQTEQEYLAKYLQDQKLFLTKEQKDFDLVNALKDSEKFEYNKIDITNNNVENIIGELVTGRLH